MIALEKDMNSQFEIYPNAPIKEALIDISIKPLDDFNINQFETIYSKIEKNYPIKEKRDRHRGTIKLSKGEQPEIKEIFNRVDAYRFLSLDRNKIVQFRLDGFTFNILKPYSEWKFFRDEAKELWNNYKDVITSFSIEKIGLRYINKLELPIKDNLKEYIRILPQIPDEINYDYINFLLRLIFIDKKTKAKAFLTETIDSKQEENCIPFLMDINTFFDVDLSNDDNDIWQKFESLRVFKNDIFSNGITEKAKRLFR